MATYDMALADTLVFAESESGSVEADPLSDTLTLEQIFCGDQDINLTLTDTLEFVGYLAIQNPARTGTTGPLRGPSGVVVSVIHRFRTSDLLQFSDSLHGTGGSILDESCNPPHLVPITTVFDWDTFTGEEWDTFGGTEWDVFGPEMPIGAFTNGDLEDPILPDVYNDHAIPTGWTKHYSAWQGPIMTNLWSVGNNMAIWSQLGSAESGLSQDVEFSAHEFSVSFDTKLEVEPATFRVYVDSILIFEETYTGHNWTTRTTPTFLVSEPEIRNIKIVVVGLTSGVWSVAGLDNFVINHES